MSARILAFRAPPPPAWFIRWADEMRDEVHELTFEYRMGLAWNWGFADPVASELRVGLKPRGWRERDALEVPFHG